MDFNQFMQNSALDLSLYLAAKVQENAAIEWKPGVFTTVDWRAIAIGCPSFCEVAGYHSWTQYFLSAQPAAVPERASDHFSWCLWYFNHVSPAFRESLMSRALRVKEVTDPLYGAQGPAMEWKNFPNPTKLYVHHPFPFEELKCLPIVSNWLEPFDLSKQGFAQSVLEERNDLLFFHSLVFMQIGEYAPVSDYRMMNAARRLRQLCSIPLNKLFNVTFISNTNPALRNKALENQKVREMCLWNKLMMDHVIHYDIKMKIRGT